MGTLKWNCEAKRGRGEEKLPDQNQDILSKSGTGTALYLFYFFLLCVLQTCFIDNI